MRAQATEIYHQAQTAVDSAHKERDYTGDQAQQLWTEAQGAAQQAHAEIQEKHRMLIMAKPQFDHMQQQVHMLVPKSKNRKSRFRTCKRVFSMMLPSKPSIMARTQVHMCRNHQAHVMHPPRLTSQNQTIIVMVRSAKPPPIKRPKGSSDVQEPNMAGSSGLGGGDQMPQASSQGVEAALSFLIAKVESLTGEMQQKASSVHAQFRRQI